MTDTAATAKTFVGEKGVGLSPGDMLKQAVTGSTKAPSGRTSSRKASSDKTLSATTSLSIAVPDVSPSSESVVPLHRKLAKLIDARTGTAAAAALGVGLALGAAATALVMPRGETGVAALAAVASDVEASRSATAKLSAEMERLAGVIAASSQRAAEDAKAIRTDLAQRMARTDQTLTSKIVSISERQEAADKDHAARLAGLTASIEKRMAAPMPAPTPQAAKPVVEPVQTGSISEAKPVVEAKPKTAAIANWALREVYDGVAILEDRKRRLVEVARGDMVPGVGRADAIERRAGSWVVVTREGIITPQEW